MLFGILASVTTLGQMSPPFEVPSSSAEKFRILWSLRAAPCSKKAYKNEYIRRVIISFIPGSHFYELGEAVSAACALPTPTLHLCRNVTLGGAKQCWPRLNHALAWVPANKHLKMQSQNGRHRLRIFNRELSRQAVFVLGSRSQLTICGMDIVWETSSHSNGVDRFVAVSADSDTTSKVILCEAADTTTFTDLMLKTSIQRCCLCGNVGFSTHSWLIDWLIGVFGFHSTCIGYTCGCRFRAFALALAYNQ